MPYQRLRARLRNFLREQVKPAVILLIVLCSFRSAIADWNVVPTGSMNPTILEGDRIFVNKLAYGLRVPFTNWEVAHWSAPQRGDVVVFFSPADGQRLVKRVVGLPGDTVRIVGNRVLINGTMAEYDPLDKDLGATLPGPQLAHEFAAEHIGGQSHPVMATPSLPARRNYGPVTVPMGHYFVLGDNRDNSADSRFIGFIPENSIVGRSSRVMYSLDVDRWPLPRWSRTLERLP